MPARPKRHVLTFEFDNPEVLRDFAKWLSNSGEQEYWTDTVMMNKNKPDDTLVATEFDYGKTFLKDNTIRVTSGPLKSVKEDYGAGPIEED